MGRTSSSSRRKSSKRKSSKLSLEARRRKKSKRNKSKKPRRHHDSDLSYSNDDSMSSVSISVSSSSSEVLSSADDDYRSRKGSAHTRARARARTDANGRRKKSRRPSSSKDLSRSKKRKRSRKDVDSRPKKSRKAKHREDVSTSSTSSDSQRCSSSQGGTSRRSEESEPERQRETSRLIKRSKRDIYKERNMSRNSTSRSPSFSGSRYNNHFCVGTPDVEKIAVGSRSGRLRSIISVVGHQHEGNHVKPEKDPCKEEIACDHDDYPSPRSNDSNDGANKMEFAYFSHVASDERWGQSVAGEEVTLSNSRKKDLIEDGIDCSSQHTGAASYRLKTSTPENENETEISAKLDCSGKDDLEMILRQKALENLRQFRGERQTNSKTTRSQESRKDTNNDQFCAATDAHDKSPMLDVSSEHHSGTDLGKISDPMLNRGLTHHTQLEKDNSYEGNFLKDPAMDQQNNIHQPLSGNNEKEKYSTSCAVDEKSGSGISTLRRGNLSSCLAVKKATIEQAPFPLNISAAKIDTAALSSSLILSSKNIQATETEAVDVSSSTGKDIANSRAKPTSIEHGPQEQQDESNDGTQYEQKTMSIMRDGEMVQVSYKVYIPKRAPALLRRQLKR